VIVVPALKILIAPPTSVKAIPLAPCAILLLVGISALGIRALLALTASPTLVLMETAWLAMLKAVKVVPFSVLETSALKNLIA
jgi:hypothetical protein